MRNVTANGWKKWKKTYTGRIRLKRVPDKRTGHPHISGNHNSSLKVNFDLKMPFAVIWEPVVNYAIYRGKLWQPYIHWVRCLLLSSMRLMARIKLKFNIKTTVLIHLATQNSAIFLLILFLTRYPKELLPFHILPRSFVLIQLFLEEGRRREEERQRQRERQK